MLRAGQDGRAAHHGFPVAKPALAVSELPAVERSHETGDNGSEPKEVRAAAEIPQTLGLR